MSDLQKAAKRAVGKQVASMIKSGMKLGLGTGSTAALAIEELGIRVREEGLDVTGVPTSFASERLARQHGISVSTLDETPELDLAFDGADEVDADMTLIKGRGAAQTREKIVAAQAARFVVLVDESKMVTRLGTKFPLPVEIVPMAAAPVMNVLRSLGAQPELRMGAKKDGPVVSDQGLWILDGMFDEITDARNVNEILLNTPGVVDHGLFIDMATDVLIGKSDGSVEHLLK
ncbi:MAG: ribose-5-phosphate isomerase RpiA [Bacteroidetes Order II. Incertae sedis bacterium]|jgi:ribose 5-phosphate isomerase A|nr:ribose-5-phosphate isomerase RpiA [Bacteroidetes Order II. bacterium]MBT4051639.1 ribose-5-phosphate isomerase RpiA [Bacteroidetes Order II. bacterium]MBT4602578.1 ribose-5-phosphate isomerase RpiA [Bacteroidetes Order II. bacterium]MBT5248768.1 ribose-5-phosphate isomerase RpiA [Bacteroidetes Order II. bacterium]MBT6200027.1 ribose-5-phosphate isomerase RpiA [Bacteroidetes Order II. bacterium]